MRNVLPLNTMAIAMGLHVRVASRTTWGRKGERLSSVKQIARRRCASPASCTAKSPTARRRSRSTGSARNKERRRDARQAWLRAEPPCWRTRLAAAPGCLNDSHLALNNQRRHPNEALNQPAAPRRARRHRRRRPAGTAPAALAQAWPSKPSAVVTAPPGGTADIVARTLADGLTPLLGQTVIVDNKAGGLGAVGTQDLLSSPRDGYTFLIAVNALVSEIPHIAKPRYDPFKDIKPLAELSRSGLVMVGNAALPASNLKELIAYVKANPGKVSYASYSTGTMSHTMGVELNKLAGLDMTHVGYKGSPPALQDVMGGHVALMFDGPATSIPMLKTGKIKAFAVSSPKRMGALPYVPTFAELGYPQIDDIGWMGLWTTPDVPADIQAKFREATLKALQQPKVAGALQGAGHGRRPAADARAAVAVAARGVRQARRQPEGHRLQAWRPSGKMARRP